MDDWSKTAWLNDTVMDGDWDDSVDYQRITVTSLGQESKLWKSLQNKP